MIFKKECLCEVSLSLAKDIKMLYSFFYPLGLLLFSKYIYFFMSMKANALYRGKCITETIGQFGKHFFKIWCNYVN